MAEERDAAVDGYAALACAHDAAMVELERKLLSWRAYASALDEQWRTEYARAEVAEAELLAGKRINWRRRALALHRLVGDLRFHAWRLRMERDGSDDHADRMTAERYELLRRLEEIESQLPERTEGRYSDDR